MKTEARAAALKEPHAAALPQARPASMGAEVEGSPATHRGSSSGSQPSSSLRQKKHCATSGLFSLGQCTKPAAAICRHRGGRQRPLPLPLPPPPLRPRAHPLGRAGAALGEGPVAEGGGADGREVEPPHVGQRRQPLHGRVQTAARAGQGGSGAGPPPSRRPSHRPQGHLRLGTGESELGEKLGLCCPICKGGGFAFIILCSAAFGSSSRCCGCCTARVVPHPGSPRSRRETEG